MANALTVRTQRHKKIGDKTSPLVYTLKKKPRNAKMHGLRRIAKEIEALGGMSTEDVLHAGKATMRNIRKKLADRNSVHLDGSRTFRTSFHCVATELEEDCTVENIDKVRVNLKVTSTLRLVNDSIATTKDAPNNITYELVSIDGGSSSGRTGGPPDNEEEEDPLG